MRAWLAAGLAAGAIGWASSHPGDPAPQPPTPSDMSTVGRQLGQTALGHPQQTPGMSDREWCLRDARYWQNAGVEVPDESECQGRPMGWWRK